MGRAVLAASRLILATALLFGPGAARVSADEPLLEAPRWRIFNDPSDISSLFINDMAQNISGGIWLATNSGIIEHMGTHFVRRDAPGLPPGTGYNCVIHAVDGTIWAGTTAGLVRYLAQEWIYPIRSGNVTAITESADGAIWAAVSPSGRDAGTTIGRPGIYRYGQGRWHRYGVPDGLPAGVVRALYSDLEGGVWAIYARGRGTGSVFRYFGERWTNIADAFAPPPGDILTVAETPDSAYWFGTYGRGVWRWKAGRWDVFESSDVSSFTAAALLPMPDGSLWAVGSPAGIVYQYDEGTWTAYPIRRAGVAGRMITKMVYVLDDSFWFLIPGAGLARFDRRGGPWWTYDQQHGIPPEASISALARGPENTLWVGTTQGLLRYENGQFVAPPYAPFVSNQEITALLGWPDGTVWIASGSPVSIPGIWKYDGATWVQLSTTPILDQSAAIRAMLRASNDDIWVGTTDREGVAGFGVFRLHDGAWTQITTNEGLPDNRILSLAEDIYGRIWVGTANGVARFDGERWDRFGASDGLRTFYASSLCAASNGSLWVGGNVPGAGASRYWEGKWAHYTADSGLASSDVWSIVEGEDGAIWLGTSRGVTRFLGAQRWTFRAASGLAKDQVWGSVLAADGSLWFGHFDGEMTRYFPISTDAPRTFIEQLPERVAHPGFLAVRWWGRDGWDRTRPADLLYAWQIDGEAWSPFAAVSSTVFSSLPRGEHRIQVMAMDQEGNVDLVGASRTFVVQPPFWLAWWFILPTTIGTLGIAIAGTIAVQRNRRWRQTQAQLLGELRRELHVAQQLQANLLPQSDPVVPGLEITGLCQPASEVGGDYFTYLWAGNGSRRIGIVVADVTGHAMQAAIPAVLFSGMLTTATRSTQNPADILATLNESLQLRTGSHTFICCTIAVFDLDAGVLRLANAGGLDPLRRRNGRTEALVVDGERLPLGMVPAVTYVEKVVSLNGGDVFVFLTDGIVEARSPDGHLFGFDRVAAVVSSSDGVASIRDALLRDAEEHLAGHEPEDDFTLLVVQVTDGENGVPGGPTERASVRRTTAHA